MTTLNRSKPKAGEFDIDYEPGVGWFIISPTGERTARSFANRNAALSARGHANRQAMAEQRCKERACLTCGKHFQSEGAHNRMCGPCRHLSPGDPSQTPHIHGRRAK